MSNFLIGLLLIGGCFIGFSCIALLLMMTWNGFFAPICFVSIDFWQAFGLVVLAPVIGSFFNY